ncbi:MAG: HD domain-containing protein [Chloroflexia bacterium]|nr:HD domain-containing protein [Chloroflexia bacterium]
MHTHGAIYRIWQFLASLWALAAPLDESPAQQRLSPGEYTLFQRLPRYDRAHSLRVFVLLRQRGVGDPLLLKAALLHDVGKAPLGEHIPLFYRGPLVLARRIPRLWSWLARERPAGHPLRPFWLYAHHAQRGAAMLRQAGSPEAVATLVAVHHDEKPPGAAARLLREADGQA